MSEDDRILIAECILKRGLRVSLKRSRAGWSICDTASEGLVQGKWFSFYEGVRRGERPPLDRFATITEALDAAETAGYWRNDRSRVTEGLAI